MVVVLFQTYNPAADLGFSLSGPAACIVYTHFMGYCYYRISDTVVLDAGAKVTVWLST